MFQKFCQSHCIIVKFFKTDCSLQIHYICDYVIFDLIICMQIYCICKIRIILHEGYKQVKKKFKNSVTTNFIKILNIFHICYFLICYLKFCHSYVYLYKERFQKNQITMKKRGQEKQQRVYRLFFLLLLTNYTPFYTKILFHQIQCIYIDKRLYMISQIHRYSVFAKTIDFENIKQFFYFYF